MIKVGLTGGIGSGKSLVARIFNKFGVPVYDSDSATKQLYFSNQKLKSELVKSFGPQTYFENGQLNRKYLGELIFSDKSKLELINKIVHPFVKLDFEEWLLKNYQTKYIIKEAAILIESGAYKQVDKIIVVNAPFDLRIKRVIERDKTTKEEVIKRMSNQLPIKKLLPFADFIVENNEENLLLPQLINIHNQMEK
jgi:dephospho-CoA kinase